MSFYKNCRCPVCHNEFRDGDDIVTCPECGTPHHRKCYEKLGECANASLHAEGYNYSTDSCKNVQSEPQEPEAKNEDLKNEFQLPFFGVENQKNICPHCKAEIPSGVLFCPKCGAKAESGEKKFAFPVAPIMQAPDFSVYNATGEKIDGELPSDAASVVGPNFSRFIPLFLKKSRNGKKAASM